ncbi:bifunctional NMN adenylyltransferase/nudix hydrolase [Sphingobium phage Lacusarx]|uniref:Bifunctional NMN adenylyltransferase/nudix hydrolase n=1 Tax=Sphingobium phage Lacusarx TaxID=1980139 RepID=A0A1W6DX89_9CAUD|nr:cytidyltransferase [Sphingobium phage Lacusarx]ARK07511.1 bifunctional NMN adenylyltransferase/nudix hydrolase [Sphingobium phage Lacusarx]
MHDICVFAGRFRPFHAGHMTVICEALQKAQYVFVIVGSINEPINFRNPFTFAEVREMIRASLSPTERDRVFIFGVEDHDTDLKWVTAVQKIVTKQADALRFGREPEIALVGYAKDSSSYYLKMFPQWGNVAIKDYFKGLDATLIREGLYMSADPLEYLAEVRRTMGEQAIPTGTYLFLREWVQTEDFLRLRDEFVFMREYLAQFPQLPYPRYFTAADACVIQSGHVLLVRRGEKPGAGLWALPGGHVGIDETFKEAAIRELIEETGITSGTGWSDFGPINKDTLRRAIRGEKLLDNPWRSTRKRTISVAYGLHLEGVELPIVTGHDDAKIARWWPIDEVTREMMFEDHFNVIQHFANDFRDL